jgi:hypothetical protein
MLKTLEMSVESEARNVLKLTTTRVRVETGWDNVA